MKLQHWVLGLLVITGFAVCGMAPKSPASNGATAGTGESRAPQEEQVLRLRLDRMLEGLDARRALIREALAVLDDGGSAEDAKRVFAGRGDARLFERERAARRARESGESRPLGSGPARRADGEDPGAVGRRGSLGRDRLSDADVAELRAMIARHLPRIDEGLTKLEAENPLAARVLVERLAPSLLEVEAIREHDGELAAIRLEEIAAGAAVVEAVRGLRATGDDAEARTRAEGVLRDAVERQFDARAKAALHEIIRMEQRLAELRTEFDERRRARDAEVAAAMERIAARARRGPASGVRRGGQPTQDD